MKKISSTSTFFHKRIFPTIWFGFIGLFIFITIFGAHKNSSPGIMIFIVRSIFILIFAAASYFFMKKTIFDLIDEAYDEGSSLLFKNSGKEILVNLKDIKNVSYSTMTNPPRVTLTIRYKTEFGDEVSFVPPISFIPFKKNPEIMELIDRIDIARG